MKSFLLKLFTWWNSQTFGTQFWTWMYGEAVGEDEFGNRYYRTCGGKIDQDAWLRAPLGDLQRLHRSLDAYRRPGTAGCTTRSIRRRRRKTISRIPGRSRTGPT